MAAQIYQGDGQYSWNGLKRVDSGILRGPTEMTFSASLYPDQPCTLKLIRDIAYTEETNHPWKILLIPSDPCNPCSAISPKA